MKWRIQFILLVTLMSLLVVGGIHLAEKGTQRVDGAFGTSQSFDIARDYRGTLEMTVLGKHYAIEEAGMIPKTKKESPKVQDEKPNNWMSAIGNTVGDWISAAAHKMGSWVGKR